MIFLKAMKTSPSLSYLSFFPQGISIFLRLLGGCVFLWGTGFLIFYFYILSLSPPADHISTEGAVIFTGGVGRISEGLELLKKGKTQRLLISGADLSVSQKDLASFSQAMSPAQWEAVDIGHQANDTVGNAQEAAHWVAQHGYKSLRLVTSYYHIPRSLLEFRQRMPSIQVVLHPVFPEGFKGSSSFSKLLLIGGAPFSPKYKLQDSLKSLFILGGEFNKLMVAAGRALWNLK